MQIIEIMKKRTLFGLAALLVLFQPLTTRATDLFQLYWRGTYYTTNSSGHIVAVPFTEQRFVKKLAQDNGVDPSQCIMVYRPDKRDTAVVLKNGQFVADFIQMEFQYFDVNNPNDTVTVRQALLYDEYHQTALGSWAGLEERRFDSNGGLQNDVLNGWFQYSLPDFADPASPSGVFMGNAVTGQRIVDTTNAP